MEKINFTDISIYDLQTELNKINKDWVIKIFTKFCKNYKQFDENWGNTCQKSGKKPRSIIIVRRIKTKLDLEMFKTLSMIGYNVKCQNEITDCNFCHNAILSKSIYDIIQSKKLKINVELPKIWNDSC